jgi:hypothetical protein
VHDALILELAAQHNVQDCIEVGAPLPYRDALAEMLGSDGLLILQAANCNEQIPAKLYEYLRAGRPILGLTDPRGDTADALRRAGVTEIAALEDAGAIAVSLERFIKAIEAGTEPTPDPRGASRRERTADLAQLLNKVAPV